MEWGSKRTEAGNRVINRNAGGAISVRLTWYVESDVLVRTSTFDAVAPGTPRTCGCITLMLAVGQGAAATTNPGINNQLTSKRIRIRVTFQGAVVCTGLIIIRRESVKYPLGTFFRRARSKPDEA